MMLLVDPALGEAFYWSTPSL